MERGFWDKLSKPIIGLSPMDGVTDAAFRFITDQYGHPDILFTEFTSVEGICAGADRLLTAFVYHKTTTPTVAQIFGSDPEAFYKVSFVIAEMGFDGIDINMGCPDEAVARKGGGAALILKPDLACNIIAKTKEGVANWTNGRTIDEVGLPVSIIDRVKQYKQQHSITATRQQLPVSVKTRTGFDDIVTEQWIANLLTARPVNISIHGRTLRQLYTGDADWEEIGKAAKLANGTGITILGNGDIKSLADAKEKIKQYGVDGVLIGRAAYGNPWVFTGETVDLQTKLRVAREHCRIFMKLIPESHFLTLRKHLAWYCKGFDGASEMRAQLLSVNNLKDVENLIGQITS